LGLVRQLIPFNFNNDTNTLVGAWHYHALIPIFYEDAQNELAEILAR
jgi:hypothetical protein